MRDRPRQTERWTEGHIRMGSDRQTDGLSDRQTERQIEETEADKDSQKQANRFLFSLMTTDLQSS